MMRILFVFCFVLFSVFGQGQASDCMQINSYDDFADVNKCIDWAIESAECSAAKDRKHYPKTYELDDENKKYEKRLRTLCINDLHAIYLNVRLYGCQETFKSEFYLPMGVNPELSMEDIYKLSISLDKCLNMDITSLENNLRKLGTQTTNMYLLNMDQVIYDIEHDKYMDHLKLTSSDTPICYSKNRNNDTIWHALVRNSSDVEMGEWIDLCVNNFKGSENKMVEMYQVVFLLTNNQGKTPIAEAVERGRVGRFSKFIEFFEENNINYNRLLKAAAEEAGVSYSQLSGAIKKGKEIKVKKKIDVDKSGINIKTRY